MSDEGLVEAPHPQGAVSAPGVDVLVVDDSRLYREGLARLLGERSEVAGVSTADCMDSLVAQLERMRPDVVILNLASRNSAELLHAARAGCPDAKLLVVGVDEEDERSIVDCAEAGVSGYITRSDSLPDLLALIRRVLVGETLVSPGISAVLLRRVRDLAENRGPAHRMAALTAREIQILRLIGLGWSNKDIAQELSIEIHTVKNHVHNVLAKLGVRRRAEAAAVVRASAGTGSTLRGI